MAVAIGAGQLGGMLHVGLLADWPGAAAVQLMAAEGLLARADGPAVARDASRRRPRAGAAASS